MYLQSLEVIGFKSFATKTVLNFHRGVTAIVGPNGCGKSNVLDAIRWVLGEQSAKALRGGEMADVIFSGTDSRPGLGMAEVSMTFAECERELGVEWNEVRITRRVFRDGNSDYFLNKTGCRLRDIQQLFMDTGIGRSAYSIMEQGKLDLILSSRPEDRRAIFEEAAGITKFKAQRKEALRKLEYTEANLLRLTDIIKEVKRQIGSLQRQAGKARRYQALMADLRTLETNLGRRQFEVLEAALQESQAEIERINASQEAQQAGIDGLETRIQAERRRLEETDERLASARQVVQDLKRQIAHAADRAAFDRERIVEFHSLVERCLQDASGAEEKLAIQETRMADADVELREIVKDLGFERDRLEKKRIAANDLMKQRADVEKSLQGLLDSISGIERELHSLRGELQGAVNIRDGSEAKLGILKSEIQQAAAALEHHQEQEKELSLQLDESLGQLHRGGERLREAEALARGVQEELHRCDQRLAGEERTLAERASRLEVLRQLNEEGEGFTGGTQAVLKGLDNPSFFKPAIAGALASCIEVEQEYIPAIEAALGLNLQAIVLKDTAVAESMIKTLAAKKLGRASLALREFMGETRVQNIPIPEGAIAWARDKVGAAKNFLPLLSRLLDGVAIVSDLGKALELKRRHGDVTFVTLAGEIVFAAGILQGGQAGEAVSSVLQRNVQIAALQKETDALRTVIKDSRARREEIFEQLEAAQSRTREAREENQQLQLGVSSLRGQLSLLEREVRETSAKGDNLRWENESTEKRRVEAVGNLADLEARFAEAQTQLGSLGGRQTELQERVQTLRRNEEEAGRELNELRIKVATEQQRHDSLDSQRLPMAARVEELKDLIAQRREDMENYREKISALEEEAGQALAECELAGAKAGDAEEAVARWMRERAAILAAAEELDNTLRILRRQLSDCHDQRGRHEVKATQTQLRLENLCEHIARRHQVDLREFSPDTYALLCAVREQQKRARKPDTDPVVEAAVPAAPLSQEVPAEAGFEEQRIDWSRVEEFVKELDQKLDAMGPINVDAIHEYDELEERHIFLEKQFDDLTTSKAELLDVIAKINSTTRKLFAETFEKIRVNFQEMFTELFGGGRANLLLADEADALESGIEIVARPPGKQLQTISLLSGGEKTMTALSLLFAIYMVKPSPFCVLDEMDAPLDESNINRFIKILDRFLTQSQFVVITHNKRTIARADVLYGVTMEEQGVSKLVGVKFSKLDEPSPKTNGAGEDPVFDSIPGIAENFGKREEFQSALSAG